ncbi:MAG TPA: hypothetical protein VIY49_02385 [Bryobacteraceae bacterium]
MDKRTVKTHASLALAMAGCSSQKETAVARENTKISWGKTRDGKPVELYTLKNAKGAEAQIATYGRTAFR